MLPWSKSFEGTPGWALASAWADQSWPPLANCKLPPNTDKGDMDTSNVRSVARRGIDRLKSFVGGESTSISVQREGGGIGINPGERVVVAMLTPPPPLLRPFLAFPRGANTTGRSLPDHQGLNTRSALPLGGPFLKGVKQALWLRSVLVHDFCNNKK